MFIVYSLEEKNIVWQGVRLNIFFKVACLQIPFCEFSDIIVYAFLNYTHRNNGYHYSACVCIVYSCLNTTFLFWLNLHISDRNTQKVSYLNS